MKSPFLLFTLKCAVILYFAACTSIERYGIASSTTPIVTQGKWKVKLFMDTNNDKTNDLAGYIFSFTTSGGISARKNGVEVKGYWAEDNDSKGLTINLGTNDPSLARLNSYWSISSATGQQVDFHHNDAANARLNIVSL
jgi:hypothetical protein